MSHRSALIAAALSAGALATAALPAQAAAPKGASPTSLAPKDCFRSSDWRNWKSPSPDVIYLQVRLHDVYRVDLVGGSNRLNDVGAHLVSKVRGSDMICAPIDLNLAISDGTFRTPLVARAITKLTPEEVAAIPPKLRP